AGDGAAAELTGDPRGLVTRDLQLAVPAPHSDGEQIGRHEGEPGWFRARDRRLNGAFAGRVAEREDRRSAGCGGPAWKVEGFRPTSGHVDVQRPVGPRSVDDRREVTLHDLRRG